LREGRPADAGYVVQVSAWDLSLLWHAWLGPAQPGVKPRGKAQGPLLRLGATGEGKARLGERS